MFLVREDFCGLCAAVPVALAGLGGSASYALSADDYAKRRVVSVIVSAASLAAIVYFLVKYSGCSSCRA